MVIKASRFGKVQINEDDILTFPEGILGFADLRKFVLLDDPTDDIFVWLQSCENEQIALPLLEPELFTDSYKAHLTKNDLELIHAQDSSKVRRFCIVTIPDDPTQMTANLKAPICINIEKKIARQCVLQDNSLAIREPIFIKLQQRVVQNPSVALKNQSAGADVAVKISQEPEAIL